MLFQMKLLAQDRLRCAEPVQILPGLPSPAAFFLYAKLLSRWCMLSVMVTFHGVCWANTHRVELFLP